ncbi:MAG: hypothetical protein Q7K42_04825, partial [Candidatus Diapherotrites archaeon]|nr:hypothetical protein [Candidatus Diapherotrites archaeon]
ISLSKRIKKLEKFFNANNNSFDCPASMQNSNEQNNNAKSEEDLKTGFVGLQKLETKFNTITNDVNVIALVQNKTTSTQTVDVDLTLNDFINDKIIKTCSQKAVQVNAGQTVPVNCQADKLAQGTYFATALISTASTQQLSEFQPILTITVLDSPGTGSTSCWAAKSTEDLAGEPIIKRFIDADTSVVYLPDTAGEDNINNLQELLDTIKFDAYLMKDGFSNDFRQDFVKYYTERNFADTPGYFSTADGKKQLKDYFLDSGALIFTQKYYPNNDQLKSPGLFRIELIGLFDEKWEFYDSQGKPNSAIIVSLNKLDAPKKNSPFYHMPLDGLVGLEGQSLNRQGYGSQFENRDESIRLTNILGQENMQSFADNGSNAITKVQTSIVRDFKKLNTDTETRGNLLNLTRNENGEIELEFSPNLATPVVMKTQHGLDEGKFSNYYIVSDANGSAIDTGSNLTYWQGLGKCYDFTQVPVTQAFDFKPDRQAVQADGIPNWEYAFALDWPSSQRQGQTFLGTMFYTPTKQQTLLQMVYPNSGATFLTPDADGKSVSLQGVSSLTANTQTANIESMQEILNLIDTGYVCATENGINSRYFWNTAKVYSAQGSKRNINTLAVTLDPKSANLELQCLG